MQTEGGIPVYLADTLFSWEIVVSLFPISLTTTTSSFLKPLTEYNRFLGLQILEAKRGHRQGWGS